MLCENLRYARFSPWKSEAIDELGRPMDEFERVLRVRRIGAHKGASHYSAYTRGASRGSLRRDVSEENVDGVHLVGS